MVLLPLVLLGWAAAGYYGWQARTSYSQMNLKSQDLLTLAMYHYDALENHPYAKSILPTMKNVSELIGLYQQIGQEKTRFSDYFTTLTEPYTYYLQYSYLPPLNIWRNPYTNAIDTNKIGQRFLDENPYTDVALIDKWTNFFKDVGNNNAFNDVSDVNIGLIEEGTDGFFKIPITLKFTSPNKRSFLLLVNKLSMTSSKENISLIDEFMFNFWEQLKSQRAAVRDAISKQPVGSIPMAGETNTDKIAGYYLSQWVQNHDAFSGIDINGIVAAAQVQTTGADLSGQDSSGVTPPVAQDYSDLVTADMIDAAIRATAGCTTEGQEVCYYKFRDKYRTLPYLAYTVGMAGDAQVDDLRTFLAQLPPIITISNFTFDKKASPFTATQEIYQGQLSIEVYGRGVSADEVTQVSQQLGQKCFGTTGATLDPAKVLDVSNTAIVKLSDVVKIDTQRTKDLVELRGLITDVQSQYDTLSNYNKIVKLFELYRMVDDASLCQ